LTTFKSPASEFLAGLTSANPRAFLASLFLGALLLALIEICLSRGLLWRLDPDWLLSTPYDDWTHAMWAVNQLDEDSGVTPIYLLGGSGSREAVISNESVEGALAAIRPGDYRFLNLGTRNQTFFETIILIENLPDTKSGLIIFGLTRFPLYSHTLVESLDALGLLHRDALPINILRHRAMFANYLNKRVAGKNLFKPLPYRNHLYEGRPPMSDAELGKVFNEIAANMTEYADYSVLNFQFLEIGVRLAQKKGYKVLLVGLPRNPVGEKFLYGRILDSYEKNLKILSDTTEAEYVNLHEQYSFPRPYFYDHLHQIDEARIIFQKRFVDLISKQLEAG
jgi:hypothetical protein